MSTVRERRDTAALNIPGDNFESAIFQDGFNAGITDEAVREMVEAGADVRRNKPNREAAMAAIKRFDNALEAYQAAVDSLEVGK